MNIDRSKMDEILQFDSLQKAEEITGKSYKEDKDTELLGFALMTENSKNKHQILTQMCDTTFSMKTESYIKVIEENGFIKIFEKEFEDVKFPEDTSKEKQYIYYLPEIGILNFDTFRGNRNGGSFYFNLKVDKDKRSQMIPCSCSFIEDDDKNFITLGELDCREALIYNIEKMKSIGKFMNPWKQRAFHWLLNYCDYEKVNEINDWNEKFKIYEEITEENISHFPEEVKKFIGGKK